MTVAPTSEPALNLNIDKLNALLNQCELDNRHPSDEELAAIGLSDRAIRRIISAMPASVAGNSAFSWYTSVFVPMGFLSDEHQQNITHLHDGLISVEEFVDTLSNDEADVFVEKFPALQERYLRRINQRYAQNFG